MRYKEVDAALADEMYRRASKESFMEAWSVRLTRRRELFGRHTLHVDHISGSDRPCPGSALNQRTVLYSDQDSTTSVDHSHEWYVPYSAGQSNM